MVRYSDLVKLFCLILFTICTKLNIQNGRQTLYPDLYLFLLAVQKAVKPGVVVCTCNPATLEAEFRNGADMNRDSKLGYVSYR